MNSGIQEVFNGIKLVKANAMEDREVKRFKTLTNELRRVNLKVASLRGITGPLNETLGVSAIAFALWFGGLQVFEGAMSSIELIVFAFALFSTMGPIKAIAEANTKVQEGLGSAKRLFKILDTVPDMENGTQSLSRFDHVIRLENVWFRYNKENDAEYVLQDVSLEVKKGETVALVGSSGSGKSTLVDLVLRFYDVERGKVTIDGTDVREFDMKQLRRLFGVVSQEVILFNDTIGGNIAYGTSQSVSNEQIIEAAKIANAHEFIENAPNQYETNIGDRGLRLSGGQRQRLSIARAMLKNPPVLIFDEATSALDNESEKIVQEAINNAMQDRTAIVIAHRLSTIKNASKIIVLDKGRVVETGNHFELIAKGGIYKKLYDMQFAKGQDGSTSEVQAEQAIDNS
ncbi:MAG: ABC transporter ATP-binding protein, partial [Chlorobiales bacterium]|nr:ABC transporter ATP-binding protein [Chlorobiales bacterium]